MKGGWTNNNNSRTATTTTRVDLVVVMEQDAITVDYYGSRVAHNHTITLVSIGLVYYYRSLIYVGVE